MASAFQSVAAHRVTTSQPPRALAQLDVDRCAALHNSIALYGWLSSGKRLADLDRKTWWARYGSSSLEKVLRPSLIKFLKRVYTLPSGNFFYYVTGLAQPKQMGALGQVLQDPDRKDIDKSRYMILYLASGDLVSHACGIVYDQEKARAIYMPSFNHIYDFDDPVLPWQKLEAILSLYVDMIEGGKAVALHYTIGSNPASIASTEDSDLMPALQRAGPSHDPETGARKSGYDTHPWTLLAYTRDDLASCLDIWERLFQAIERRAGIAQLPYDAETTTLCGRSILSASSIKKGFAYDLLSHARQPGIWYVAPGLRLPGATEFINQPFKHIPEQYPKECKGIMMPILFFRCEGTISSKQANFRYPFSTVETVPCGLYLDAFPNRQNPFEDACRLVLPFQIGANKQARFSDGKVMPRSHFNLYGHGINPIITRHGPKLVAILENWLTNVESGHWDVDQQGVSGGVEVWRQADTAEHWSKYQSAHQVI